MVEGLKMDFDFHDDFRRKQLEKEQNTKESPLPLPFVISHMKS